MINDALISQVKTLSVADFIELIGVVWESFSPAEIPASNEEQDLLDARLADVTLNPDNQSPWSEVQLRLKQLIP